MPHPPDDRAGPTLLVLVTAVAALVGAGVAVLFCGQQQPPALARDGDGTAVAIAALQRQVEQLERRLGEIPATAPATELERRDVVASEELKTLRDLEARLLRLEQQRAVAAPPVAEVVPERDPAVVAAEAAAEIARRQNEVLDARSSAAVKLEAWRWMRHQKDSWNDAVVAQMVGLGLQSADAAVRADVWRQADGNQRHAALVPALLLALQTDAEAKVREEAAETLENYFDRPEVQQALDYSSRNDAEPSVRRQASQSIASAQRPRR